MHKKNNIEENHKAYLEEEAKRQKEIDALRAKDTLIKGVYYSPNKFGIQPPEILIEKVKQDEPDDIEIELYSFDISRKKTVWIQWNLQYYNLALGGFAEFWFVDEEQNSIEYKYIYFTDVAKEVAKFIGITEEEFYKREELLEEE